MGEGVSWISPLFVPVQGCIFFLVCTEAGSLLLCVTCKKPIKREEEEEEEEALLKKARDKSDLVATAAPAGVAKRRHKAPWTLLLGSH